MGGNSRPKKSSSLFAIFNIFKAKRSRNGEDAWDDPVKAYRVWPSVEDRARWVAKPSIDRKPSIYIAKVLAATQYAEHEHHPIPVFN